jgi:hypothetical protein
MSDHHLIGLLLGTEEDWPTAFEAIVRRLGAVRGGTGAEHRFDVERMVMRSTSKECSAPVPPRPGDRPARLLVLPPP